MHVTYDPINPLWHHLKLLLVSSNLVQVLQETLLQCQFFCQCSSFSTNTSPSSCYLDISLHACLLVDSSSLNFNPLLRISCKTQYNLAATYYGVVFPDVGFLVSFWGPKFMTGEWRCYSKLGRLILMGMENSMPKSLTYADSILFPASLLTYMAWSSGRRDIGMCSVPFNSCLNIVPSNHINHLSVNFDAFSMTCVMKIGDSLLQSQSPSWNTACLLLSCCSKLHNPNSYPNVSDHPQWRKSSS